MPLIWWWWCNAVSKSTDAKLNLNWHFDNDNKDEEEKESEEKNFSVQAMHVHYYWRNTTFPHRTDSGLSRRTYAYGRYLHKLYQFSFLPATHSWTKVVRFSCPRQNEILAKPLATIRTTDRFTSLSLSPILTNRSAPAFLCSLVVSKMFRLSLENNQRRHWSSTSAKQTSIHFRVVLRTLKRT